MKKDSTHLNQFRIKEGEGATTDADGLNGNFKFALAGVIVQVSSSETEIEGYEHLIAVAFDKPQSSIISRLTAKDPVPRCLTNEEKMQVKRLFWEDDECVVEYLPAKGSQMPFHFTATHLWRRTFSEFPMPIRQKKEGN
jgi:hypothetical protein